MKRIAAILAAGFLAVVPDLGLGMSGSAFAEVSSSRQDADRKAITDIILEQDAAWNAGDPQAYVRRMLPDATCTNIVGVFFKSRDAFVANIGDILGGIFKGSVNHQTVEGIRFIAPDIAVVDTISALGGMTRVPVGAQAVDGVMHSRPNQVMVRRADGWWIASFHNVTINPHFLPKS